MESWVTILSMVILAGGAISLMYFAGRIRKIISTEREAGDILGSMMMELRSRLQKQDVRIVDQQVRLEVLELKLVRGQTTTRIIKEERPVQSVMSHSTELPSISKNVYSKTSEGVNESLTETEVRVVDALKEGPLTPKQVQSKIGKSREHTARLLKKLFEANIVKRRTGSRPFVYELLV